MTCSNIFEEQVYFYKNEKLKLGHGNSQTIKTNIYLYSDIDVIEIASECRSVSRHILVT